MPAPRKIFRIEESPHFRPPGQVDAAPTSRRHAEIVQALTVLAAALGTTAPVDTAAPAGGGSLTLQTDHLTRVAHELDAVTAGTAQATHRILEAAEQIDRIANDLSAALNGKIERDLAQDISEFAIRIFEACNFQDVIGQRINKVMTTLSVIQDHIVHALDGAATPAPPPDAGPQTLYGPRLDDDTGHMTQHEIDMLFGR